jgi:hypothetical protein
MIMKTGPLLLQNSFPRRPWHSWDGKTTSLQSPTLMKRPKRMYDSSFKGARMIENCGRSSDDESSMDEAFITDWKNVENRISEYVSITLFDRFFIF